jgi:hypothetical protein
MHSTTRGPKLPIECKQPRRGLSQVSKPKHSRPNLVVHQANRTRRRVGRGALGASSDGDGCEDDTPFRQIDDGHSLSPPLGRESLVGRNEPPTEVKDLVGVRRVEDSHPPTLPVRPCGTGSFGTSSLLGTRCRETVHCAPPISANASGQPPDHVRDVSHGRVVWGDCGTRPVANHGRAGPRGTTDRTAILAPHIERAVASATHGVSEPALAQERTDFGARTTWLVALHTYGAFLERF